MQPFKLLVGNRMKQTKYKVGAERVKHPLDCNSATFVWNGIVLAERWISWKKYGKTETHGNFSKIRSLNGKVLCVSATASRIFS